MARDTILGLTEAIRDRELTAVDAVQQCVDRIARYGQRLGCFRELHFESALQQAEKIDQRRSREAEIGGLHGLPLALKDNIVSTLGSSAAGASILEHYQSPFNATAVERIQSSDGVVIGRTNCDEFSMGSSNEHCPFATVRNPWSHGHVPGGSSGGSAAAVAAGFCPAALGSDTGGSIRQPASFCGVVGLKPTYGRVSRWGLIAFGSSLDQIGPLTHTVGDAAMILRTIAGVDDRDATTADVAVPDYLSRIEQPIENLRIGVPRQYRGESNDPEVNRVLDEAIERYRDMGAIIVDLDLPMTDYAIATYYVIAPAEASSNLARYDGVRYGRRVPTDSGGLEDLYLESRSQGFGPEVQRRIMLGTYVLSAGYYDAYYKRAMQARRLIRQEFEQAFSGCHAILGPTAPTPAFRIGDTVHGPFSKGDIASIPHGAAVFLLCKKKGVLS